MITELGRFFFMLGLATAIVSYIVVSLLSASGAPVPQVLVEASGLMSAIRGQLSLGGALTLFTTVTSGILMALGFISMFFRGRQINMDAGKVAALMLYITLYSIAADGVAIILRGMTALYFTMTPPITGLGAVFINTIYAIALVTLGYYLLVRVFGIPAE